MAILKALIRAANNEDGTQTLICAGYENNLDIGKLARIVIADSEDAQAWFDDVSNAQTILDALTSGETSTRVRDWFYVQDLKTKIPARINQLDTQIGLVDGADVGDLRTYMKQLMRTQKEVLRAIIFIGKKVHQSDRV